MVAECSTGHKPEVISILFLPPLWGIYDGKQLILFCNRILLSVFFFIFTNIFIKCYFPYFLGPKKIFFQ